LSDGRAGRLVEVAGSGDGFEALAVLNVEPAGHSGDDGSAVDAPIAAAGLPLPYKV
jgi:hypothetical protein